MTDPHSADLPADWRAAALDPPRAGAATLPQARLRVEAEDFVVEEELGFAPDGEGSHALLRVRKRGANTEWVARQLAREARCRPHDVGFAGLKDRHAVTTQWFTVPLGRRTPDSWRGCGGEGFEVLEAHAHRRKLPRGALRGNRFELRLRDVSDPAALAAGLERIAREGVPNYFGPQRFGRGGGNLARLGALAPADRDRTYVLSAARSLVFNAVLAERVAAGDWNRLLAGDVANLDGTGSVFPVPALDATLEERCARLDLHPTGPLWGQGESPATGEVARREAAVAACFGAATALIKAAGMHQERRALRLAVRDVAWRADPAHAADVIVSFRLGRGSFATTVMREVAAFEPVEESGAG